MSDGNGNGRRYFVLNRATGESKFPILAPSDFERLAGIFRTQRKTQLAVNLHLADIEGEALLEKLEELDRQKIRYSDLIGWCNTQEGMFQYVLRSIQKDNPKAGPEDVDRVIHDNNELLKVAAGVAGLALEKKTESPPPGEAPATAIGAAMQI